MKMYCELAQYKAHQGWKTGLQLARVKKGLLYFLIYSIQSLSQIGFANTCTSTTQNMDTEHEQEPKKYTEERSELVICANGF